MPDWSKPVYSSSASEIGYREEGQELIVTWAKGGRQSIYSPVPEDIALQAANAPSAGSFLRTEIQPNFSHRYG
jgi:hypothetical protein